MSRRAPLDAGAFSELRRIAILTSEASRAAEAAIVEAGVQDLVANAEILVICALHNRGPQRPSSLLGPTGLTRGGLTNLLDRLELRGVITRERGAIPGDRRGVLVSLTSRGRATATALGRAAVASFRENRATIDEMLALIDSLPGIEPQASTGLPMDQVELVEHLAATGATISNALSVERREDTHPARTAIVLACAIEEGGTQPSRIQAVTSLSSSGVTGLIDDLEARGLVRRRTPDDPTDRRVVVVDATPGGRTELDGRLRAFRAHLGELRDSFQRVVATVDVG